jgi:predicted permease
MADLWQDVRFALRMLGKSPVLTGIVILTLALGIGANTAVFGLVNGLLLRPLPVNAPDRIVVLAAKVEGDTIGVFQLSASQFVDLQKQATEFSDVFGSRVDVGGLSFDNHANQFVYSRVTGNFFTGLGVQPALGRLFLPSEGAQGGKDAYVVLGYGYWQKVFGGDNNVIGKQVLVNGQAGTVIGVAPREFHGTNFALDMDGYVPMNAFRQDDGVSFWTNRTDREMTVMGRMKPGVTLKQARVSVGLIATRLAEAYPATDKGVSIRVIPERFARPQPYATDVVPFIAGIFLVLAGLVLLLACTNVANLLLVRSTMRQREMAIRSAMGAGRVRLIRQLLTESVVLAFFGAIGGLLLGRWAVGAMSGMLPESKFPIRLDFGFDWRVFAYALTAAVATGIVVGVWPALRAGSTDVNSILHGAGRSDTAGAGRHRVRSVLVVAQVCGSLVLLIVAGLFVRSLSRAQHAYLGFDPDHVLNVSVDPKAVGYDDTRTNAFYKEIETRVRALPGVQSVGMASSVPMGMNSDGRMVYIEGRPLEPGKVAPLVLMNHVDASYLNAMRVPLLRGRQFTESDDEHAPLVAIINQQMAKDFWPNEDAVGKRFSTEGPNGPYTEVVGVAGNGRYVFIGWDHEQYFFVPLKQSFESFRTLQIRSSVPPETLGSEVQEQIRALDPNMPVSNVETMQRTLDGPNGYFVFRVAAMLAAAMGLLGLTLAMVGVYGVVSFAASQRTHEIGIRLALGANRGDILRLVLRQGLTLVIAGVVAGVLVAFALTRSMATLLVGVSPTDALTFVTATVLLGGIGLWACYAPARRAMKLDPMVALRYE